MKHRGKSPGEGGRSGPPPRLSRAQLWQFRLLALVVAPLLVLVGVELALRLAGFGYPASFLLSSLHHGHATFIQNNQFGWRFFGKRMARAPYPISIPRDKPPATIRVFVFGESAALGDPQPAFGLPRMLQAILSLRHPGMRFEVVNAAMTAINSHVILPIARDCVAAHGDIWVLYMGNNEVVGPFGAGTVFGSQALPLPLIRTSLALKTTRLGQWIDTARQAWQKPAADRSEWGGMEMFVNQQVSARDPRMAAVYRNFARNLEDMIRLGHDSGAGLVVSTVAVNLKDCAPFASQHRAGLSESDERKWEEEMKAGAQAQAAGNLGEALAQFKAAAQLDEGSAESQFRLGRCLLAAGDASGARHALIAARDLDTLRFRCDSRLNDLTRKAASGRAAERILLADAEETLAAAAPDQVPGWDLFYEHVHLTFHGNWLLARALAEQIEKLLPQDASPAAWPSEADCARRLGRTDRDLGPAVADIISRVTDPPFLTQINHDELIRYLTKQAGASRGASLAAAVQSAQAAIKMAPNEPELYENLAALEKSAKHASAAEEAARRAIELLPSCGEDWSQLGLILVEEKNYQEAASAFRQAFDLNRQDVWALQNLAMSLEKLGRKSDAIREYRRALALTPRFGLAWIGLGQLLESMGQKKEAADCYEKALRNRIHLSADLATLARFCMGRGWFEAASTNYNDALKLDPADASLSLEAGQAHFLFGMELGKSGRPALAARQFQAAVQLMPEVVEARLNLGIALYEDGHFAESRHELEEVAARRPANAVAQKYLTLLRDKLGPAGK
ncbi:MAG: tetratricopeptide repeat protein [Limisphaerales bacterium]